MMWDTHSSCSDSSFSDFDDDELSCSGTLTEDRHNGNPKAPSTVASLRDLAAGVTAKYLDFDSLADLCMKCALDETLLEKISAKSFPKDVKRMKAIFTCALKSTKEFIKAEEILATDDGILESRQIGLLLTTRIAAKKSLESFTTTTITFQQQRITGVSCSACQKDTWCRHSMAAVLHKMKFPDKVPVSAPLADLLNGMSRDQLQKLVQYTVQQSKKEIMLPLCRNIDDLRDTKSEISICSGAPDPTFDDTSDSEETLWQLSIDQLLKNLNRPSFIFSCLPWCEEESNDFRQGNHVLRKPIRQVIGLLNCGETDRAGQILAVLATKLFEDHPIPGMDCIFVSQLRRTIEVSCTCFILSFEGKGREILIEAVKDLYRKNENRAVSIQVSMNTPHISSIRIPPLSLNEEVDNNAPESMLYANPVRASSVQIHRLEANFCQVEELLPIMVYRFESIRLYMDSPEAQTRLLQYGIFLLRKILRITKKFSPISPTEDLTEVNDVSENVKGVCSDGNDPSPPKAKRQKMDTTAYHHTTEVEGIQKGQIKFVLLYVIYYMYQSDALCICNEEDLGVLGESVMRAMEMTDEDGNIDQMISDEILTDILSSYKSTIQKSDSALHHIQVYVRAWLAHCDDPSNSRNLLTNGLCSFFVEQEGLDISLRFQLWGQVASFALKHDTHQADSYVPGCEISQLVSMTRLILDLPYGESDIICTNTVTKVLEACLASEPTFTSVFILEEFRKNSASLSHRLHFQLLLKILLKSLQFDGGYFRHSSKDMIFEELQIYGSKIGIQFPIIILQNWQNVVDFFSCIHQSILLQTVRNTISVWHEASPPLSNDVVQALIHYLSLSTNHDIECSELVDFIPSGSSRELAFHTISFNSDSYPYQLLFYVARKAEENSKVPPARFDILSQIGNELLQKAFDRCRNEYPLRSNVRDPMVRDSLLWLINRIASNGREVNAYGQQFFSFMHNLREIFREDVELQHAFLSVMMSSPRFMHQVRALHISDATDRGGFNPIWYAWFQSRFPNDSNVGPIDYSNPSRCNNK